MAGILGKKIGMTNVFDENGRFIPVTLIKTGPSVVLGTRTQEHDGYRAIVLGYGDIRASKLKQPQRKWFEKLNISPKRIIKEIRIESPPVFKTGDKIGANLFKMGDYVDITGTTIGKGFQGGVKRWNWKGGDKAHGSMFHRAPGSIGASSFPSRVFKGHHMPGHMGGVKRTTQNLKVVSVDEEKDILAVKGSVPGHKGSLLVVKHARKKTEHPNK